MITELLDTYPEARITAEAISRGLTNFRISKFPDDNVIDSGYENEVCTVHVPLPLAPPNFHYNCIPLFVCVCKSALKINKCFCSYVVPNDNYTYVYLMCSIHTPYPSTHYTHAHSQIPSTPHQVSSLPPRPPSHSTTPGPAHPCLAIALAYTGKTTETTV